MCFFFDRQSTPKMQPFTKEDLHKAINMPFSGRDAAIITDRGWDRTQQDFMALMYAKKLNEGYNFLGWKFWQIISYMIIKERTNGAPVPVNELINFNADNSLEIRVDKMKEGPDHTLEVRVRNFATETGEFVNIFDTDRVIEFCREVADKICLEKIDISLKKQEEDDDDD